MLFRAIVAAAIAAVIPSTLLSQAHVTKEPIANDGTEIQIDLPAELHMENTGGSDGPRGPGSGKGLCVFTSINHAAYWQNVESLQGFQSWMTKFPGGGDPQKVDRMIAKLCKEKDYPLPDYLNLRTNDLEILKLALATGRPVSVTYCKSFTGRYRGKTISHMVNLMAAGVGKGPDGKGWWTILDNNHPGSYEWLSESQFLSTYSAGRTGWSVVLLAPAPPPVPH